MTMEAITKSRFIIPSLIVSIIFIGIFRLCGLLMLRQKIFIEKSNIYSFMKEYDLVKNKNLLLIAELTDIESPKMLRENLQTTCNNDKRNLLINVSNWKNYHGSFIERSRFAMNVTNKHLLRSF